MKPPPLHLMRPRRCCGRSGHRQPQHRAKELTAPGQPTAPGPRWRPHPRAYIRDAIRSASAPVRLLLHASHPYPSLRRNRLQAQRLIVNRSRSKGLSKDRQPGKGRFPLITPARLRTARLPAPIPPDGSPQNAICSRGKAGPSDDSVSPLVCNSPLLSKVAKRPVQPDSRVTEHPIG
jgi:hypothetical protein